MSTSHHRSDGALSMKTLTCERELDRLQQEPVQVFPLEPNERLGYFHLWRRHSRHVVVRRL